jgi:hypothetical protein
MGEQDAASMVFELSITEQQFPRYDPSHGTPDPMVRRVAHVRARGGQATFEQTDYGHPGRFNDWEPRGIDAKLQPRTEELRRICESLGSLL